MSFIEAKNILYLSKKDIGEDIHIIKEVTKNEDGKYEDNIRIIKNFKRPFWVTKEIYRNHTAKKESELIKKVDMYMSTDSDLIKNIPPRLGYQYIGVRDMRTIKRSPYIYGIDVDARTILKHKYLKQANEQVTPYRVGAFDIEKNVLTDTITVITLATYDKARVAVHKSLIGNIQDVEKRLLSMYDKYIPDSELKEKIKENLIIKIFEDEVDMVKWIFQEANYFGIDFLTAWNMKYDISEILDLLEKRNINPADVFHYDKIPSKYKFFKFIEGSSQKVTESGKVVPKNPEEQWHVVKSTTNYYFIDAMCSHRYVRVGGATVPGGYSLDNILKIEGIEQKLKFQDASAFKGIEWHIYMSKNKPLEYVIYNVWDVMSLLALDAKTKDLAVSLPLLSGVSHFDIFNSGPKKIVDALFFFYLKHGRVLGVKDPTANNDKLLGLDEWIVTLPSHLMTEHGLKIISEDPNIITNIKAFVYDLDQKSGYPSNTMAANVSKDTTHREIIAIQDIDKSVFKLHNIDLMYGPTNALTYCQVMFNMPNLFELKQAYQRQVD